LFFIATPLFEAYHASLLVSSPKIYYLAPVGFDVRTREIAYREYAIKLNPTENQKGWKDSLEDFKRQMVITVSQDEFLQKA